MPVKACSIKPVVTVYLHAAGDQTSGRSDQQNGSGDYSEETFTRIRKDYLTFAEHYLAIWIFALCRSLRWKATTCFAK